MRIPLSADYRALLDGTFRPPSMILGLLPPQRGRPTVTDVAARLESSDLAVTDLRAASERMAEWAHWELTGRARFGEESDPWPFHVWGERAQRVADGILSLYSGLTGEDIACVKASQWAIGVGCRFGDTPLASYHRQLRVLDAAIPDATALWDLPACAFRSAVWIRSAAASHVPPPPTSLFTIHAVTEDEPDNDRVWMHTHGLHRCGTPEIEIMDVGREESTVMGHLLNSLAHMFIEGRVPLAGKGFGVGAGLALVWMSWQRAMRYLRRGLPGTGEDRTEEHRHPSAVLFAPRRRLFVRRYASPACYVPILEANPLLWISETETERMSRLARESLPRFAALRDRFHEEEDWAFLVKLGYQVDGAEGEDDREHLWFRVHELHGDRVEATLLNQPYAIARMREGQRDIHDLARLTDWSILCPLGTFGPDSVALLERQVAAGPGG